MNRHLPERLPWITALSPQVRRGLFRLYIAVAIPWAVWFGFQILLIASRPYWYWRHVWPAFWSMLAVPIGAPLFFLIALWVIAGFHKSESARPDPELSQQFHTILTDVINRDGNSAREARQAIYERARSTLKAAPAPDTGAQSVSLEAAISRVEREALAREKQIDVELSRLKPASTVLLVASLFFPQWWAIDATSLSLYWVARLRR